MTATNVRNRTAFPVTLPYPYSGVLPPGGSCVLPGTQAVVEPRLGTLAGYVFDMHEVQDTELLNGPINGTFLAPASAKVLSVGPIAAKSATGISASVLATAANAFPGPFTNPVSPRNATAVAAATYDGGSITIVGTDQFGNAQTEVIAAVANSTVVGVKIWKTITAVSKAAIGVAAAGCSIGTGDKVGAGALVADTVGMLMVGATAEAVTIDAVNDAFTPTTVPNATTYTLLANVQQVLAP